MESPEHLPRIAEHDSVRVVLFAGDSLLPCEPCSICREERGPIYYVALGMLFVAKRGERSTQNKGFILVGFGNGSKYFIKSLILTDFSLRENHKHYDSHFAFFSRFVARRSLENPANIYKDCGLARSAGCVLTFIYRMIVGSGNSGTRIPEILARSAAAGKLSSKFR